MFPHLHPLVHVLLSASEFLFQLSKAFLGGTVFLLANTILSARVWDTHCFLLKPAIHTYKQDICQLTDLLQRLSLNLEGYDASLKVVNLLRFALLPAIQEGKCRHMCVFTHPKIPLNALE